VELSPEQRAFLEANRGAVMVTLRRDGTPHAAEVEHNAKNNRMRAR